MPFETKVDKKMRQKNGQKRQSAILLINLKRKEKERFNNFFRYNRFHFILKSPS